MPAGLQAGTVVAGRYAIEKLLGQGGMAAVYRARHTTTDRLCAVKFLLPELAHLPKTRRKFLQQARIAGRLCPHPNIVDIFDAGVDELSELPFLAMELLEGQPLGGLIANGPPAPAVRSRLLGQLTDALERAHRKGVVHRDLKPSNVFLCADHEGQLLVKVLDLGIAKILEDTPEDTATQMGTPWYAAPEQLGISVRTLAADRGIMVAGEITPATDVWAFGLVALELLTGEPASDYWSVDSLPALVEKSALEPRRAPSRRLTAAGRLPADFDAWFLRCTHHDAAKRWETIAKASRALADVLEEPAAGEIPAPAATSAPSDRGFTPDDL